MTDPAKSKRMEDRFPVCLYPRNGGGPDPVQIRALFLQGFAVLEGRLAWITRASEFGKACAVIEFVRMGIRFGWIKYREPAPGTTRPHGLCLWDGRLTAGRWKSS